MKGYYFTVLLLFQLFVGYSQPVNLETPDCEAHFMATPDAHNPYLMHFHDQSTGNITSWYWNFSDPGPNGTSNLQNPDHLFSRSGSFFIYLTVSSGTGQCNNSIVVSLTIHVPGACVADYHYSVDPGDQRLYHFNETSTGPVNRWHWSFGDGTYSDQRNPNHQYMTDGNYAVCLTAYHNDSSLCNDTKCDTIRIFDPYQCKAQFNAELDSLSPQQRNYKFTSISAGNPNYYEWKFGDGGYSNNGPQVYHQFKKPGDYKVCLTVKKKNGSVVLCSDSSCRNIHAPEYFNLGGHLFTGSSPINNPVSTGDTGIVYLFRKSGSKYIPVDTSVFTYLGYYAFAGLLPGPYLVKSYLSAGSAHHHDYFPTYYPQQLSWGEAETIDIQDSSKFHSHVSMMPLNTVVSGNGRIEGRVFPGDPGIGGNKPVESAEVVLFDSQLIPLKFTESDHDGEYKFHDLPMGAYYLYVEVPGKFSRYTAVWLDENKPVKPDVMLEIYNHDVTGIEPMLTNDNIQVAVFPNPAVSGFSVTINSLTSSVLTFRLNDSRGQVIQNFTSNYYPPSCAFRMDAGKLLPGIYFLWIEDGRGWRKVEKVVKL